MARPNVVVFFTDQQRHDTVGLHGNPMNLTPNFDAFARRGTFLTNSFTCQPVCGPARACLQTGRYPTTIGSWSNGRPLRAGEKTLAHHFSAAGYDTAYIGKWHLADTTGHVPKNQRGGYDYWLASNVLEFTSDAHHVTMYDEKNRAVFCPGYRVDALTDAAIRYISNRVAHPQPQLFASGDMDKNDARPAPHNAADNPFYLFISYIEPHHQNMRDDYPAPDGYAQRYAANAYVPPDLVALKGSSPQHLPGYYGQVKRLDECFGRLLEALKSLNILDNTIVLFTSDHGNHFKTRNPEYKRSCHEASIHVPTAFAGPGFDAGGELRQLVSLIDLPATLLDAAGIPVPKTMQGRSILPVVQGHAKDWRDEMFIQISESQIGRALRTQRWKYSVKAPDKSGWDAPSSDVYAEEFLYDLHADPWELTNLIGIESHAAVTSRLRKRLIARIKEAENLTATITPAPSRPAGQRRVFDSEANV